MRNHSSLHIKTTTMLAWNLEFLMKLIVVLKEYNLQYCSVPMRVDIYDKTSEKNDIGRITVLQYVYVLKNRDPDLWSATDTVYWGDFFRWTCGHWCVICSIDQRNKVSQVKDKIADELLIGLYTSMFYQIQTSRLTNFYCN